MPATQKGNASPAHVLGVDGCRAGWLAAEIRLADNRLQAKFAIQFRDIVRMADDAEMTVADMPIGLAEAGPRACEAAARARLRPLRHSSVFSPPRRGMLDFETYAEANAWGKAQARRLTGKEAGGGLSKQAWMIAPKIREVDACMTPARQARLGEGHPEVAFWRLNGAAPCAHPKRKPEGQAERRALLAANGLDPDPLFPAVKAAAKGGVGLDDLYDACALALTARARLEGDAVRLGDGARDARGLVMEIWG